jgi:hypothetical protein
LRQARLAAATGPVARELFGAERHLDVYRRVLKMRPGREYQPGA